MDSETSQKTPSKTYAMMVTAPDTFGGGWVLRRACRAFPAWHKLTPPASPHRSGSLMAVSVDVHNRYVDAPMIELLTAVC
jgi:hypothetical protein